MEQSVEERKEREERLKASNDRIDAIIAEHDRQWEALEAKDQAAKEAGTLVGRYISEPYADGHAIYRITEEDDGGDDLVMIEMVEIGDAWVIPYWGRRAAIRREYVEQSIESRDKVKELFSNKRG